MPSKLRKFAQTWIINTLAVAMAAWFVPGIRYKGAPDLLVASLILGILNAVIRPILMLLALPLLIFTLGLFMLIINAVLLWFVGQISPGHFFVDGFWSAFWGALIISFISLVLNSLTGSGSSRIVVHRGRKPRGPDENSGNGPIIDV